MAGPAGDVKAPGVGKIPRKWLWIGVGGAGLFVGWRWMQARKAASATPAVTGDVGAPVDTSGVVGAPASGNVQYAGTVQDNTGTTSSTSTGGTSPGTIRTNAEWTQGAVDKLTNTGGWAASAVYTSLGDFLGRRPLTDGEQQIVRAAIAAVGPPPEGGPYEVIAQVGVVSLTAPTGLKVTSVSKTSVTITWNKVPGAVIYYIYRSGLSGDQVGSRDNVATIGSLKAGTHYSFQVAAGAATGKLGPKSSTLSVTTKK